MVVFGCVEADSALKTQRGIIMLGKKVLMKVTCTLLVTGLIASTMVGCGSKKENSDTSAKSNNDSTVEFKNVELNFWNGFTGPDGKGMQKIVDGFNEEYKGKIKVKTQTMEWGPYYDKLVTAVSSGKAPDVGIMHADNIAKFAKKGILVDLGKFTDKYGLTESEFIPAVWKAGVYESKRYGVPLDVHPVGLYYNVDLLKKAGFDKPPTNMQEFLDMAQKMTKDLDGDGKIDQWGFATPSAWPAQQIFWSLLYQFGGKATNEDGTTATYDSPEAVQALQFLVDTVYKYKISPSNIQSDGDLTLFKQGKVGFTINGIWEISGFEEQKGLNFATAPLPVFGSKPAVHANSHNFVLYKQKKPNNVKEQAAMVFIDYVTKHSIEWAKAGQIPARNSVRNSDEFKALPKQFEFAKQVDNIVFPVASPTFADAWGPSLEAISAAVLNTSKPEKALKDAVEKAKKQVEANR